MEHYLLKFIDNASRQLVALEGQASYTINHFLNSFLHQLGGNLQQVKEPLSEVAAAFQGKYGTRVFSEEELKLMILFREKSLDVSVKWLVSWEEIKGLLVLEDNDLILYYARRLAKKELTVDELPPSGITKEAIETTKRGNNIFTIKTTEIQIEPAYEMKNFSFDIHSNPYFLALSGKM